MVNKIFLDINILIDFLDATRKEHIAAKELFEAIENKKVEAFFSESVINTTYYLIRKSVSPATLKSLMQWLLAIIKVIPCTNEIVAEAYRNAQNDFEDAVLYQLALHNHLDYFVTSDEKDYKRIEKAATKVVSAKQLIKLI